MQPDGTLQPERRPDEQPDPSDSDASYWLARTIWALGEGYAAFRHADPAFAAFLRAAAGPGRRARSTGRCSTTYGSYLEHRRPPHARLADRRRRRRLGRGRARSRGLRRGPAAPGDGPRTRWPSSPTASPRCPAATPARGRSARVLPWALSRSRLARLGLADAGRAGHGRPTCSATARWPRAAARDSFTFDPWLLTSGGPDNGRLPTRIDAQPDRLRRRLAGPVADRHRARGRATGSPASTAAWFFGANASGRAGLRPGHRRHLRRGRRRRHGQPQLRRGVDDPRAADDARPRRAPDGQADRARRHRAGAGRHHRPSQAEDGHAGRRRDRRAARRRCGPASRSTAAPATPSLRRRQHRDVRPRRAPGRAGPAGRRPAAGQHRRSPRSRPAAPLGTVRSGDIGAQGDSPAPGALLPVTLPARCRPTPAP